VFFSFKGFFIVTQNFFVMYLSACHDGLDEGAKPNHGAQGKGI
jgi:hypothetical protein